MDTTTTLQLSLDGARRGRRIGFNLAQQRAAQIVLDNVKDTKEALRLFRLIMDLNDHV
jgi:hypothetical protein